MTEELRFSADAALIDRLGRELVSKQETALIELVKNCYDADATRVKVTLESDRLTIRDDGSGMTREELINGFLKLASDSKVTEPLSRLYRRQRAGRKGIGRFSTQRLGSELTLRTWTNKDQNGLELRINWWQFTRGRLLQDIPVELDEIAPGPRGTEILISSLEDEWDESQVRRCWRGVMNLQQPFPVAPVQSRPSLDPGFDVEFYKVGDLFSDPELVADFQTEVLDHMHAVIDMRVDDNGTAEWRLTKNKFGADRPWTRFHDKDRNSEDPPRYNHLRNVYMTAHYVILAPELIPSPVYSRLRETLREEGGVRLYRNGFRVVPYGEENDDWLSLDAIYARRGSVLAPIANRNFFGVVEVNDPEGANFEEHTSREGLIEKPAVVELRDAASVVLMTAVNKIAEDRGKKTSAGHSTPTAPNPQPLLEKLRETVRRAAEVTAAAKDAAKGDGEHEKNATAEQAVALLTEGGQQFQAAIGEFEAAAKALADDQAMLRFLSTLGLTAAEFSHETTMTFAALRIDFSGIIDFAASSRPNDDDWLAKLERAKSMFGRLDALTSYLSDLASARAIRELAPVSLSRSIKDFYQGMAPLALRASVKLTFNTPPLDPLLTKPMHMAELASVLLNFYTNSVKAMKATQNERLVHIEAFRDDNQVAFRFSDTGKGIPFNLRKRIFDPFFTTTTAASAHVTSIEEVTGTGLGLWIVRKIAENAKGEVEVINPPEGFMTCIEFRLPADED